MSVKVKLDPNKSSKWQSDFDNFTKKINFPKIFHRDLPLNLLRKILIWKDLKS